MGESQLCLGCMQPREDAPLCPNCGWEHDSGAESPYHLPPGTLLENRYLIGKVISEGNFGLIYMALDQTDGSRLVIKEFLPQDIATRYPDKPEVFVKNIEVQNDFSFGLGKFLEEGMALQKISPCRGIPNVLALFKTNRTAYLVMTHIDGINLTRFLKKNGGQISFALLLKIVRPVIDGLSAVHRNGLLHYDIHPDNIIVNKSHQGSLVNFNASGLAIAHSQKTLRSQLRSAYSPEELYQSSEAHGPWSDIYALGATIYNAITGRTLPDALSRLEKDTLKRPSRLGKNLSIEAESALMRALAVRPSMRFRKVEDFHEGLLKGQSVYEIKKSNSAIDAFTQAVCQECGHSNEILKTDLESGTSACAACQKPLRVDDSTRQQPPAAAAAATAKPDPAENRKIFKNKAKPRSRHFEEKPAIINIDCPVCQNTNEVLRNDLNIGVLCTSCGVDLSTVSFDDSQIPDEIDDATETQIEESIAPNGSYEIPGFDENGTITEMPEAPPQEDFPPDLQETIPDISVPPLDLPEAPPERQEPPETVPEIDLPPEAPSPKPKRKRVRTAPKSKPARPVVEEAPQIAETPPAPKAPPEQQESLNPIDCPRCKKRNYFTVEQILSGTRCNNCRFEFLSSPILGHDQYAPETPVIEVEVGFRKTVAILAGGLGIILLGVLGFFWLQQGPPPAEVQYSELVQRGDLSVELQDFEKAIGAYRKALELKPGDSTVIEKIFDVETQLEEFRRSENEKEWLGLIRAQILEADSLFNRGQLDEAKSLYEDALIDMPEDAHILAQLQKIEERIKSMAASRRTVKQPKPLKQIRLENLFELQAAINNAPPNSQIKLPTGIIKLSEPLTITRKIHLAGAGQNHTIIIASTGEKLVDVLDTDVSISGVGFEYEGEGPASIIVARNSRLNINNCMFKGAKAPAESVTGGAGILLNGNSTGTIQKSRFTGNLYGIRIIENAKPVLSNNEIWQNSTGIRIDDRSRPTIRGNRIHDNRGNGISIFDNARAQVLSNKIMNNQNNGIYMKTQRYSGKFSKNEILSNKDSGILLAGQSQPELVSNDIKLNGSGGIFFRESARGTARNNLVEGNRGGGIKVTNSSKPSIEGNRIKANKGDGIELLNHAQPVIQKNTITQNNGDGISILIDRSAGQILSNTCSDNQGYGISILKASKPTMLNNILGGNREGSLYEEEVLE